ncbi:MAG TPA: thioredoxin [Gemmatimonadales bacterium]|jgi:thioredoxin 1
MSDSTVTVTNQTFDGEVTNAKGLVLVDFWANWCGPCKMIAPTLDALAKEYAGKLKITKLDVDANQQIAARYNVRSIPTLMFFKDGRHVDTLVGAHPRPSLEAKINQHLAA